MHTKKTKKIIAFLLVAITVLSCFILSVSAASLADCFTSGSYMNARYVSYDSITGDLHHYKVSWGKTEGYGSSHYIRAYITKDFLGDSGRIWSTYPHRSHYVESNEVLVGTGELGAIGGILYTAYAKYGTSIN